MEDQFNQLLLCQKNIQDLQMLNSRLEKKLELQDQKLSQISLNLAQRNEDLLLTIDKYTPSKTFRDETQYLRNYLDNKTKGFQSQFEQLQLQQNPYNNSSLQKQMTLLREEQQQLNQTTVEKQTRIMKDALFKIESIEKNIHLDTQQQIEQLTKKAGEMELNFMALFAQKQKLLEKITLSQENQNAKINVFESTLNQQLSTITKEQQHSLRKHQEYNSAGQTPVQNGKRLNFDTDLPLEMLKRQESALNNVTMSIRNIEKKLADNNNNLHSSQPQLKRELSFDQFSLSVQKPASQPQKFQLPSDLKEQYRATTPKSHRQKSEPKSQRLKTDESKELNDNVASPLQQELKSPVINSNRDISKNPILKKVSPKPIVASPTTNIYEDVRIQKDYDMKMSQIKQQEEKIRQQKLKQQLDYDRQLQNMRNSQSQVSNESIIRNDSYFLKNETSLLRESQEIKKSSGGLRSLMERSKERDVKEQKQDIRPSQKKQQTNTQSKFEQLSKLQPKQQQQQQQQQQLQQQGRKSRTNQMKSLANQQKQQQDESADEVVYQLDEDGYLMDEQGNYLLDEKGNYIQISEQDLEELKKQNLVVEQG